MVSEQIERRDKEIAVDDFDHDCAIRRRPHRQIIPTKHRIYTHTQHKRTVEYRPYCVQSG